MCATWNTKDENFDRDLPDLLAGKFEAIRTQEGFEGFMFHEYIAVLASIVAFSPLLPDAAQWGILHRALFSSARQSEKITADTIIREISKEETAYLRSPKIPIVISTELSVRYFDELTKTAISGCRMTFDRLLPLRFGQPRADIMDRAKLALACDLPRRYTPIRIALKARSEDEALETAIDALDLLRGIWNLYINRRRPSRSSGGKRSPVNKVLLGPVHTLHEPSGKMSPIPSWWFEDLYRGPVQPYQLSNEWTELKHYEKFIRGKLHGHKYRAETESSIIRYVRALDSTDWNSAFVKLWSLLEKLTATSPKETYKKTIDRTLFLQHERHYNRQVLNHLRSARNRSVHSGKEALGLETILFQAKNHAEMLLEFHIVNYFGFRNMKDAADFLDLPPDIPDLQSRIASLEQQMKLAKQAIQFDSM